MSTSVPPSDVAATPRTGPVGVALIGAGVISTQYLDNLTAFPDVVVHAVTDLDPEAARSRAEQYSIEGHGTQPGGGDHRQPDDPGGPRRGRPGRDPRGQACLE